MGKTIINGVDISECKHFFSDDMCDNEQTLSCVCVKNKECEYKQLKRLQAENERLKEDIKTWKYQTVKRDEISDAWYDKAEQYKQCLQEIRDMADFKCALPSTELCHCKACDYADNIIDKINEVIGAEE